MSIRCESSNFAPSNHALASCSGSVPRDPPLTRGSGRTDLRGPRRSFTKTSATNFSLIVVFSPISSSLILPPALPGLPAPSRWASPVVSALRNTSTIMIWARPSGPSDQNFGVKFSFCRNPRCSFVLLDRDTRCGQSSHAISCIDRTLAKRYASRAERMRVASMPPSSRLSHADRTIPSQCDVQSEVQIWTSLRFQNAIRAQRSRYDSLVDNLSADVRLQACSTDRLLRSCLPESKARDINIVDPVKLPHINHR